MAGAPDILHFFTRYEGVGEQEPPVGRGPAKICKLCSYVWTFSCSLHFLIPNSDKYGIDQHNGVGRYIFSPTTANANLRRHLYSVHAKEYDKANSQFNWGYKLSTEL